MRYVLIGLLGFIAGGMIGMMLYCLVSINKDGDAELDAEFYMDLTRDEDVLDEPHGTD